jgi:hypothetical protein
MTWQRRRRGDEGYTMVMTALLLVPLMLFAALAVDVGGFYTRAHEVQRAADAASLAGVVWMPDDYDQAVIVARATARRNGFNHGVNGVTVAVNRVTGQPRQLEVVITDPNVPTYFGKIVRDKISITRSAVGRYVLPVPLGSPKNYLGTGTLGTAALPREELWASVNGYCTGEEQGDQRASAFLFPSTSSCPSGSSNADYSSGNYTYTIELPSSRSYNTDVAVYDPNYQDGSPAGDFNPGGHSQTSMSTRFTLFQVDDTPLDDTNNPKMSSVGGCSGATSTTDGDRSFSPNTTDSNFTFNPDATKFTSSSRWWRLCTIPAAAPGGRYLLQVQNQNNPDTTPELTKGSNNYGIVATPSSPQRVCDSRTDTTCPKVYADEYLSVRAAANGSTAEFFLAQIGPEHAGKTMVVTLWDPAEGGQTLRIQRPTGTNTWAFETFDWSSSGGASGNDVSSIDVAGNNFNANLLTITIELPATYAPPSDNQWWRIYYQFASANVTDRTTWSVSVEGNPVHLVR